MIEQQKSKTYRIIDTGGFFVVGIGILLLPIHISFRFILSGIWLGIGVWASNEDKKNDKH